ncbi:MAG: TrpB-like pyridoxal phosphate-dependent enzyme [Dehalococcoidales bacterium]|nr:TrpB-like pyridoxal phosphate-dependent enzyme [Dehalococcoidales bacterium]
MDIKETPDSWYNIIPDLEFSIPPVMNPSGYPLNHHDLEYMAPYPIIDQELERKERRIAIPEEVRDIYSNWRPTPMYRAERLEKSLGTTARIYYKYEGCSPTGSHEMNTAIAQAYYAAQDKDIKCVVTATGNGEWGASLATACTYFGIKCKVYMVRSSYEEKAFGRYLMEILGAEVIASPSDKTPAGRKALARDPYSQGSLNVALSEAFNEANSRDDAKFLWGTVMNHVLLHQTVIGIEAKAQMHKAGSDPDIIICAIGGGSAFGGMVFPLYPGRKADTRIIAVEAACCPSLSRGRYAYDYGDAEGLSPMLKMYTLGHNFVPPSARAGGMRYHGLSPLVSALYREKQIEAKTYSQRQALEAAITFARVEGLVTAPETAYALAAVFDEALKCKERNERKNILFLLNASGNLDLDTFKEFIGGAMEDPASSEENINAALGQLPEISERKTG